MSFDSESYLELEAPNSVGTSASGVSFATSSGDLLELSSCGAGIFRLRVGANTRPDYGLIRLRAQACETTQPRTATWLLNAGDSAFEFSGSPLAFRLLYRNANVLESSSDRRIDGTLRLPTIGRLHRGEQWAVALALASGEPVYGLGEKFGPLNRRGALIHSQTDAAAGANSDLSSHNTPFAWGAAPSANGRRAYWGFYVHTPAGVTHGVGFADWSHRSYVALVDDEALDVFFFAADTASGILDLYTQLTGRAAQVPLWSLGLWASRAHFDSADEAISLAAELRRRSLPCDVLMLGGQSAWDRETCFNFEWDRSRFGDMRAALATIKGKHHLRIAVTEYPYISLDAALFDEFAARRFLLTDSDGDPAIIGETDIASTAHAHNAPAPLRQSAIVDFSNPAAFAWWHDAHAALFGDGVDVIDCDCSAQVPTDAIASNGDSGSRMRNIYPLLFNRCVHEATAKFGAAAGTAPLVLSSSGWTGSQRYPLHWINDAQSDWEGLAACIRGALSCGMSGTPYQAWALCGAYTAADPSAELYLRSMQASVFASHMHIAAGAGGEPWFAAAEAEAVTRKWLAFRYRLLPYLQQLIAPAERGMPVMRAMPLAFPGNAFVRDCDTQFMCGDALFVAPIVSAGGEVEITLPPGAWYDLNSRRRFPGQRTLRYKAAMHQFPVFGREGYALPLGVPVQHTGEIDWARPLNQLWVFGPPAHALEGFAQAKIAAAGEGAMAVHASPDVDVQIFGEAPGLTVKPM